MDTPITTPKLQLQNYGGTLRSQNQPKCMNQPRTYYCIVHHRAGQVGGIDDGRPGADRRGEPARGGRARSSGEPYEEHQDGRVPQAGHRCLSGVHGRTGAGELLIARGGIVYRAYGTHKNLYIYLFLLTIFGPVYYGPP